MILQARKVNRLITVVLAIIALVQFCFSQTPPQFSGRFGVGVYSLYPDIGEKRVEPSFRGFVNVDHLFTESIHGALDARIRHDVSTKIEQSRVYEAWLGWRLSPKWDVQAGRLGSRGFGGIGFLDGGRIIYSPEPKLELSVYGGNEPDLNTFGLGKDISKFGVAVSGHAIDYSHSWGVSILEQQCQGKLDRRLLTQNLSFTPFARSYLYQTLELDFAYRDNNSDKSGIRISNFQINASESSGQKWRFQQSVGFRRGFKLLRSMRDIADTLFESEPVYDYSAGINYRMIPQIDWHSNVRFQRREKNNDNGTSYGLGLTANTKQIKPLYTFIDAGFNNNLYYRGSSYSISLEKELLAGLSPRLGYYIERNEYKSGFGGGESRYDSNRWELSLWYWLNDWSAGVTGELTTANSQQDKVILFDLGYRIPSHKK